MALFRSAATHARGLEEDVDFFLQAGVGKKASAIERALEGRDASRCVLALDDGDDFHDNQPFCCNANLKDILGAGHGYCGFSNSFREGATESRVRWALDRCLAGERDAVPFPNSPRPQHEIFRCDGGSCSDMPGCACFSSKVCSR
jgi:hypothetical protein